MSKLFELLNSIIRKLNLSVKMESQELTDEQKSQVRENIGAASIDDIGNGGGSIEQVQADYIQEDTTQPDYIKNRPFYDNRVKIHYSYAENPEPVSFDCAPINYSFYKISDMVLTKEEMFGSKFTINGREIDKFAENDVLIETNELLIVQDTSVSNGYAFCFCNTVGTCDFTFSGYSFSVDVPEVGIYRIYGLGLGMSDITSIEIVISGELKTLDLKYLPKNMALGYEIKKFSDIIWNGNTDGLPSVSQELNSGSEGTYVFSAYKVSDEYISEKDIIGATVTSSDGDLGTLTEDHIDMMDTGSYSVSRNGMFCSIKQPNDSVLVSQIGLTFTLPERGVWFITMSVGGQIYLYGALSLVSTTELKQIDKKFLPEIDALPKVSESDNGKFLCVENGVWTTKSMEEWSGGSY